MDLEEINISLYNYGLTSLVQKSIRSKKFKIDLVPCSVGLSFALPPGMSEINLPKFVTG